MIGLKSHSEPLSLSEEEDRIFGIAGTLLSLSFYWVCLVFLTGLGGRARL